MAIGNIPTSDSLNFQLGQLAVALREWAHDVTVFHTAVTTLGQAGLEGLSQPFSDDDAAAFIYAANVLNTVAALYYGTAAQPDAFNFDNALASTWGTK